MKNNNDGIVIMNEFLAVFNEAIAKPTRPTWLPEKDGNQGAHDAMEKLGKSSAIQQLTSFIATREKFHEDNLDVAQSNGGKPITIKKLRNADNEDKDLQIAKDILPRIKNLPDQATLKPIADGEENKPHKWIVTIKPPADMDELKPEKITVITRSNVEAKSIARKQYMEKYRASGYAANKCEILTHLAD